MKGAASSYLKETSHEDSSLSATCLRPQVRRSPKAWPVKAFVPGESLRLRAAVRMGTKNKAEDPGSLDSHHSCDPGNGDRLRVRPALERWSLTELSQMTKIFYTCAVGPVARDYGALEVWRMQLRNRMFMFDFN